MQKYYLAFIIAISTLCPLPSFAQPRESWLPESGVKSAYSPLAIPTTMRPLQESLAALLAKDYHITSMAHDGPSGAVFTLASQRQTVLCALNPPDLQTDQNVPTSRCWALTEPVLTNKSGKR
ncbi:hypothetical protein [Acetobacter okinawensis]|uniref:hypothetical protein n=1 Tax=Acetobacter okinawensis TaxID=1076594 RepID=UPI000A392B65|nr:hypothetical protein [Acetobacter okinawensis]